jgi:hypothetical protein
MKKTMTILAVLVIICAASFTANAEVSVGGYYRGNGTYVQPHYRSDPDGNPDNNWSTYPNVNPHTGVRGSKHLNAEDFSSIPISLQNKPTNMPVYPSGIHGQDSSWSKPTLL